MTFYDSKNYYCDCWVCNNNFCLHLILAEEVANA